MSATEKTSSNVLPPSIVVPCSESQIESLLDKEWLLTNRLGSYASSTVVGCNTRRYHGLLVASTSPPVLKIVTLSSVMEQLTVGGATCDLATNEFVGTFSPRGIAHLVEFRNDPAPTYVYRAGAGTLTKEIIISESSNAVAIRYTLRGASGAIKVWPFVAMRDFHHLRRVHEPHQMTFETIEGGVAVQDRMASQDLLNLVGKEAVFQPKPQWWYRFSYRAELARGQDGLEDLYTPGSFDYQLKDAQSVQFTASLGEALPLGFETTLRRRVQRLEELSLAVGRKADETTMRLAMAGDSFIVQRRFADFSTSTTILSGYHWFADWGRDAFISLPGLLLATGRFDQARQVFKTFAANITAGMVPNRFDDYGPVAHYNSIDASLWFIAAADRYVTATSDTDFWAEVLAPAAAAILTAYQEGTRFDIRADADGLITGGSHHTQLTWMDAALGDEVVTPRHGKAVEVNALWYNAHRVMASRYLAINEKLARHFEHQADLIGPAFVRTFWNAAAGCLYDCVTDGQPDGSIRPNQILAVSLPYSPLSRQQQEGVLQVVTDKLLTPVGLRTLSPDDHRYRARYGGSWESRDRAYHQGTAWAWLIGPFIEAYLKLHGDSRNAIEQARKYLAGFDEHIQQAGLGYISEIFDGDAPHATRGCIAQAWSVGEVLRAKLLIAQYERGLGGR